MGRLYHGYVSHNQRVHQHKDFPFHGGMTRTQQPTNTRLLFFPMDPPKTKGAGTAKDDWSTGKLESKRLLSPKPCPIFKRAGTAET